MKFERNTTPKRNVEFSVEAKKEGVTVYEIFSRKFSSLDEATEVHKAEKRSLWIREGILRGGIIFGVVQGVEIVSDAITNQPDGSSFDSGNLIQAVTTFAALLILRYSIANDLSKRIKGDTVVLDQLASLNESSESNTTNSELPSDLLQ